jgi:hypothetical protein
MTKFKRAYWNDPDDGVCSSNVFIKQTKGEVVIVTRGDGIDFEVFAHELSPYREDGRIQRRFR